MCHGFRREENVAAEIAHLGGNMIDDDNRSLMTNGVNHAGLLISARASGDGTVFHGLLPRVVAFGQAGGLGSYTVIMISIGLADVHTTCKCRQSLLVGTGVRVDSSNFPPVNANA